MWNNSISGLNPKGIPCTYNWIFLRNLEQYDIQQWSLIVTKDTQQFPLIQTEISVCRHHQCMHARSYRLRIDRPRLLHHGGQKVHISLLGIRRYVSILLCR